MRRAIIAGAIARVANAYWVDPAPSATDAVAMKELGDNIGWTPIPTQSPMHRDLFRRQAETAILGYLAPDNTCGYVGGRLGGVKTCETDANCAAVLGTDSFYTMGCCGAGACTMQGACYDYADISDCDQTCKQDINILKCSSAAPYCYPYSVPGMNMGFYSCDTVTTSVFQDFPTTYDGQTSVETWLALRSADFESLLASDTTTAVSVTSGGRTLNPSTNTATSSTGTGTASLVTSTPTSVSSTDSGKSKTPIGAIVGGVIGGIAALALIAGGLIILCLRKRKTKQNAPAAGPTAPAPPMSYQNGAPAGPPSGGNGYFAPVAAGVKYDHSDPKYEQQSIPAQTPLSPAPAYSAPISPAQSPPPPNDPRYSYAPPPPQGYSEAPANSYAPPPQQVNYPPPGAPVQHATQGPAAPIELGNNVAVPNQYQGRPVYEAA